MYWRTGPGILRACANRSCGAIVADKYCHAGIHPHTRGDINPHVNRHGDRHAHPAHGEGCPFARPDTGGYELSLVERGGLL